MPLLVDACAAAADGAALPPAVARFVQLGSGPDGALPQLWQPIDDLLELAESSSNLRAVKASRFVKGFKAYLEESGPETCTVGWNQGSGGDLSFTVSYLPDADSDVSALGLRGHLLRAALSAHPQQRYFDANACADAFYTQSGVSVIDRKRGRRTPGTDAPPSLTLFVKKTVDCWEPARATFSTKTARYKQMRYSPSHMLLADLGRGEDTRAHNAAVVDAAVADFWSGVRAAHYIPSPELVAGVTERLRNLLLAGIVGIADSFACNGEDLEKDFRLFLLGLPGAGKSAFVHLLAVNLERVLRARFDTQQRVAVVKVPLNAVTPEALRQQAVVKGLSDHSIERMIEQNISAGHMVILHLEENPEDPAVQVQIDATITLVFQKLTRRYPAYSRHVMVVTTSNHPLADGLRPFYGPPLVLASPSADERARWVASQVSLTANASTVSPDPVAAAAAAAHTSSSPLVVDIPVVPGVSDMRLLTMFAASMGYAVRRHFLRRHAQERREVSVVRDEDCPGGESLWTLSNGAHTARVACSARFVCCDVSSEDAERRQCESVVRMAAEGILSPGVIVVRSEAAEAAVPMVEACYGAELGGGGLVEERLTLLEAADSVKVFGSPREIRGGLFKTIDDNNCPNAEGYFNYVVVHARVTEAGQFILRELLEQGDMSRNHRLGVRKSGVLFVLTLDSPDTVITPQVQSRAHLVL
eukprot:Rhum_TRINITY_DN11216_c0_g1::Rhum_TRINITY_DN11216_c0_g1_i1::g.43391::m.43391